MALSVRALMSLSCASYSIASDAELTVYAGAVAAALSLTIWQATPVTMGDAKKALQFMAVTEAGIPLTDWQDKVGAVFKCATKLATKMHSTPELILVRDANDELAALLAMKDLFAIKGLTCRHYFKQWANSESTDKFDPEAAKRAKAEAEAAKMRALLDMRSNIDASSEAALKAAAATDTAAIEAAAALTPVQRFALTVAAMSDAAEIDAFHAVLSARQAELRAIADAAAAVMPEPAPGEAPVSRGKRAAKRRAAVAA
jgi:hypothetical protein